MVNHADLRNGEMGKGKTREGTTAEGTTGEGMKERVGIRKPENQSEFVFQKSEGKK
jgi:hypothetical protein